MKLQAGIRLLKEIEGNGDPIRDSDIFDAVLKFYRKWRSFSCGFSGHLPTGNRPLTGVEGIAYRSIASP